ncbi:chalcone isomerase family protein [Zobellella sp. DQSA1]|uniref:chalcone isomerase family protein n=1 Tax=Zobellella sp. DQSA1 TaxID=3342386 RepID=UPI0035C17318
MKKWLPILLFLAVPVWASPLSDLTLVGEGKMRWLFWDLYQARFYSGDGRYRPGDFPQALALHYQRDIRQEDLLNATVEEWRRLGVDWKPEWQQQLSRLWPSVRKRDELVLRADKDGVSRFYFNWQLLGEIVDPEFAPAFLAIWLSPDSRDPALTRQLKGN